MAEPTKHTKVAIHSCVLIKSKSHSKYMCSSLAPANAHVAPVLSNIIEKQSFQKMKRARNDSGGQMCRDFEKGTCFR